MSTPASTSSSEPALGAAIRLLDERGCLTPACMCFVDELQRDQRAVVDRHVRSCSICAQQQASLARAAVQVRNARPQLSMPVEVRLLARQALLRALSQRSRSGRLRVRRRSRALRPFSRRLPAFDVGKHQRRKALLWSALIAVLGGLLGLIVALWLA